MLAPRVGRPVSIEGAICLQAVASSSVQSVGYSVVAAPPFQNSETGGKTRAECLIVHSLRYMGVRVGIQRGDRYGGRVAVNKAHGFRFRRFGIIDIGQQADEIGDGHLALGLRGLFRRFAELASETRPVARGGAIGEPCWVKTLGEAEERPVQPVNVNTVMKVVGIEPQGQLFAAMLLQEF